MKKIQVVSIRWFDASYQRGECTLKELVPRVEMVTAGILVREDLETISVAMDYYTDEELWRHVQHIPKVNVLERIDMTPALYGDDE